MAASHLHLEIGSKSHILPKSTSGNQMSLYTTYGEEMSNSRHTNTINTT